MVKTKKSTKLKSLQTKKNKTKLEMVISSRLVALYILFLIALVAAIAVVIQFHTLDAKTYRLPKNAVVVGDHIYNLGDKYDPNSKQVVRGIAFVTPKTLDTKAKTIAKKPGKKIVCNAPIAKGMKWKTAEPWLIDPTNEQALDEDTLHRFMSVYFGKWETKAAVQIFGEGTKTIGLTAESSGAPDGNNEIFFGEIEQNGVIAVTIIWGIFDGPLAQREIVEWDQVYDQTDFEWSLTGEPGKMDFRNIAAHEIGHAAGLGHPNDSCKDETMFRYAGSGELKKRTLGSGDASGINALY